MLIQILLFLFAAGLLWFSAEWIVDSAAAVARSCNISELVIGLTIVAMGTSAPEFLVTFTAAMKGVSDISLSNIVGSNIFNMGIILGLMAFLRPIPSSPSMVKRDGLLLLAVVAFIAAMGQTGTLSRPVGAGLILLLVSYVTLLILRRPKDLPVEENDGCRKADWKDYPKLAVGFAGVALGGTLMVDSATAIATALGVSTWLIGVTIVAAGTSLPELVTCLAASIRGRNDMLLGNLIGSDLFNFAGVLGATSLIKPLPVSPQAQTGLLITVGALVIVLLFIRTGWRVTRTEGALLIGMGLARWLPAIL